MCLFAGTLPDLTNFFLHIVFGEGLCPMSACLVTSVKVQPPGFCPQFPPAEHTSTDNIRGGEKQNGFSAEVKCLIIS